MRSIYPTLILSLFFCFSFAESAPKEKITLMQARGLERGNCYREAAALSCDKNCVLDFFPNTQAQLSLVIHDISPQDRKKLGRFFEVEFQILDQGTAKVIQLSPLDSKQLKEKIEASSGYFNKIRCKKK